MSAAREIDIFEFLDYRAFLKAYYAERKENGRGFSYRAFSKRAGLRSPNYLKLVIDGERNLTVTMADRFGAACGLRDDGLAYFCDLVAFNQAKGSDRARHYGRLTGFRQYRRIHRLELAHHEYHSKWYLPAIRELAARVDFRDDPDWIASSLIPAISPTQARKAVTTLVDLGLLVRGSDGKLGQRDELVSTGPQTRGMHIANFHRTMLRRAGEAIDIIEAPKRDISSLTLCVGSDGLGRVKERIQRFRRELLELAAAEPDPEQVIQVNFQLFPLSHSRAEEAQP